MDFGSGMDLSGLQKQRIEYRPELPPCLQAVPLSHALFSFEIFSFIFFFLLWILLNFPIAWILFCNVGG